MRLTELLVSKSPNLSPCLDRIELDESSLAARLKSIEPLTSLEHSTLGDPVAHLAFYCALASHSLTNAFILTQRQAALRRIETSTNQLASNLIQKHQEADQWISVGISHLTTSRQHLLKPAVTAKRTETGWRITGVVPWVTAARESKALVIAACDEDDYSKQYLFYLPMQNHGIECQQDMDLMALAESSTCEVYLNAVALAKDDLLHGPSENVMTASQAGGAGGLQTSALALGLSARIIDHIHLKSQTITAIRALSDKFRERWMEVYQRLTLANKQTATGDPTTDPAKLRKDANDLVTRVSQANLAIEKGSGYLQTSDASRWVRESLFFLVWSCPQPIANEHLCDLSHF